MGISWATARFIVIISPTSKTEAYDAFEAAGIEPTRLHTIFRDDGFVDRPDGRNVARETLSAVDLADADVVPRVLRYTARVADLYLVSKRANPEMLVKLRYSLADDGYSLEPAGDPLAAITGLAAAANRALTDASAIRLELTRLERALPDDAGAAVGRAKNLVEATAKAILGMRGLPVSDSDDVPALVNQATIALGVHPTQAGGPHPEQVRKVLGRLTALTQDLAELRNRQGDGHGMTGVPTIDAATGRLAARAAIAWCGFMVDVAMGASRAAAPTAGAGTGS